MSVSVICGARENKTKKNKQQHISICSWTAKEKLSDLGIVLCDHTSPVAVVSEPVLFSPVAVPALAPAFNDFLIFHFSSVTQLPDTD